MSARCTIVFGILLGLIIGCSSDPDDPTPTEPDVSVPDMPDMDRDLAEEDAAPDMEEMRPLLPPGRERAANRIHVLPPVPSNCDEPDHLQRIPFFYSSRDVVPIVLGDIVDNVVVEPNVTLTSASLDTRAMRLAPDSSETCETEADCPTGYRCGATGRAGAERQCLVPTSVAFTPLSMRTDYDPGSWPDSRQLVSILIQNDAMHEGRLPTDSGSLFDEEGERDLFADADRAYDRTLQHRTMIKDFAISLASVADATRTRVSVWWYSGTRPIETRPLVNTDAQNDHFTSDLSIAASLIDEMPNPLPRPANLYQAISQVLDRDLTLDRYREYEKFLFVFTASPNQIWDPDHSYRAIRDRLVDANVHVIIVHLDSPIDASKVRDLPAYYAGNQQCRDDPNCQPAPPCTSDTDCLNFEECRQVTIYGQSAMEAPRLSDLPHCMPRYREDGRTGPIDVYADLACLTRGHYIYASQVEDMINIWRTIAGLIDGQFSIEADFSALRAASRETGFYRLSGYWLGGLGNADLVERLSGRAGAQAPNDTRHIVRFGRP